VVRYSTPGSFGEDFFFGGKTAADLSFGGMVLSMALFSSSLSLSSSASSHSFSLVSFSSSSLLSTSLASLSLSEFASSVVSRIVS
jgi:hypothetical protein